MYIRKQKCFNTHPILPVVLRTAGKKKRKFNVSLWKANIRKKARTEGREYNTKERKAVPKRSVKPQNCEKCRFKCNTKFTEVERAQIFQTYYSLETYDRQRRFICDMILKVTPAQKTTGRKSKSLQYFLEIGDRKRTCLSKLFLENSRQRTENSFVHLRKEDSLNFWRKRWKSSP